MTSVANRKRFDDLIGIRYAKCGTDRGAGVDCLWVVREVAQRLFNDFESWEMPLTGYEVQEAIAAGGALEKRWERIKWPQRVGDLVTGEHAGEPYVAIMDDPIGRTMLTANARNGAARIPFRKLEGVVSIWRRKVVR